MRMNKDQYQAALQCVKNFLVCRCYDIRHTYEEIEDGQWIVQCIDVSYDSPCTESYPEFIKQLLKRLDNGSYITGNPLMYQSQNPWKQRDSALVWRLAVLTETDSK